MADGNTPLKVLLLLAGGSNGLTARPSDDPAADTPPAAVEILSLVSRSCLEILVRAAEAGEGQRVVRCFGFATRPEDTLCPVF